MTAPSDRAAPPTAPAATSAGRGVVLIAFAKFYFMVIGLAIQVLLPAIVPVAMFGAYLLVSAVVSPFNNVAVTGSIQTVSRFIAQTPERARQVEHAGLRMHLWLGLPVALLFIAAAPLVARLLHDPSKTMPLMVAGVILGLYAFYAVLIGTANGLRQFHKQAGLDISSATLRMIGILGMAAAGFGVAGIVAGWAAASAVILVAAAIWIGLPRLAPTTERLPLRPMIAYFFSVAVYLILFNLLLFEDTWIIKRLVTEHYRDAAPRITAALAAHLPWVADVTGFRFDPSHLADVQIGYYGGAQQLARLPYQAIIAATFVVFPLVSRSTFTEDREATRRYIHVTMRYSLIFAMALAVVLAALPAGMLAIPYGPEYAYMGGPALAALSLGTVMFSLFAIAGTILNGAGQVRVAIGTAAVTLVIAVAGNWIAISYCAPGRDLLLVAGAVTGGAMLVGAALSGWALARTVGAFLPLASGLRVALATAIALGLGRVLPAAGKLVTLGEGALVAVVFFAVLIATRELGKSDLAAIKAVRRSRGSGGDS
jgi:stage V sporulation protein B